MFVLSIKKNQQLLAVEKMWSLGHLVEIWPHDWQTKPKIRGAWGVRGKTK